MTICIFPGTFNPIHTAHLKMAEFVLQNKNIEKIIFIPAYIPPHKDIDKSIANHRFNMVKLAIKYNPKFEISDIEYKSAGKSYTINTVKNLKTKYNISGKINLIIGTDAFNKIRSWYKSDELKELVHFIVFPRKGDIINKCDFQDFDFEIVNSPMIDISSTGLRLGEEKGLIKEVKDYINRNELYN